MARDIAVTDCRIALDGSESDSKALDPLLGVLTLRRKVRDFGRSEHVFRTRPIEQSERILRSWIPERLW